MTRPLALAVALLLALSVPAEAGGWRWTRLTWYGSEYFQQRTACGLRYTRELRGVATWLDLPCGTLVRLRYRGRVITVPVVDRMPRHPLVVLDATAAVACDPWPIGLNKPGSRRGRCFSRDAEYKVVRR